MKKMINGMLVCFLFFFLTLGIKELQLFLNADKEQDSLKEQFVRIPADNQNNLDADNPFNRYIDFTALEKVNEDIAGWIYIPGTKIDYPIMIGDTDQEYLKKDFEGKLSSLGSIFAFCNVDLNQDFHVCLYGHNMISGQMFGSLKEYMNEEYAKSYKKAYLYTKGSTKELELLSVFQCENTDAIFELKEQEWICSKEEDFISNLKKRSSVNLEVPKKKTTQIFTLATCQGRAGGTHRLVLNFILTEEKFVLQ